MIEVHSTRSGKKTASIHGKALHSAYDPETQARRYVERSLTEAQPSVVLIIGECMGYVSNAVKDALPSTKIIAFYLDSQLRPHTCQHDGSMWFPDSRMSPFEYLRSLLYEQEAEGLKVLEWAPAMRVWTDNASLVAQAIGDIIRELTGNIATTTGFGRIWLSNAIRNSLELPETMCSLNQGGTVLIAASGPTLGKTLPYIKEYRNRFELWALPSSLRSLVCYGIEPDLVVTTDPGFYASLHYRYLPETPVPTAYPLTAASRIPTNGRDAILLNQNSFFENSILRVIDTHACPVPANGTVAGTCLLLAHACEKRVLYAGLDFVGDDIRNHVQPHTFDELIRETSERIRPQTSILYERFHRMNPIQITDRAYTTRALRTYASWFDRYVNKHDDLDVYRLLSSPFHLDSVIDIDESDIQSFLSNLPDSSTGIGIRRATPGRENVRSGLSDLVNNWIRTLSRENTEYRNTRQQLLYLLETRAILDATEIRRRGCTEEADKRERDAVESAVDFLQSLSMIL